LHDRYDSSSNFVKFVTDPVAKEAIDNWLTGANAVVEGITAEVLGQISEEARQVALGFTPVFKEPIVFCTGKLAAITQ
jgi:hypothetical protein